MARYVPILALAGAVMAVVSGVPAMSVAQAVHEPARAAVAASRPPALSSPGDHRAGLQARPAVPAPAFLARAGAARPAGPVQGVLQDVTARSPASTWAVGYRCVPGCHSASAVQRTLIRHWNGRTWSTVPSPNPNPGADWDYLFSVSAVSATDAWAVGYDSLPVSSRIEISGTLILHWNGRTWSAVPSPNPSTEFNELDAVSAISATSAWAVVYDQTRPEPAVMNR